jgi:hypothetical protein
MTQKNKEFENFDSTMRKLIQVPHSEIKAKLEAEKAEKQRKKKREAKQQAPACDRASGGEG